MKKTNKKTAVRNIVFAVGVILLLMAVYLIFNPSDFNRVIQTIVIALMGLGLILLKNHLFPRRFCDTCGRQLWLPGGTDHLWCAVWNHPDLAARGWYYHLRGEHEKERTLQEHVRRGPSEIRAKLTAIVRLLVIGPLMAIILSPYLMSVKWAIMLVTISHIILMCIVFISNVIYLRDYCRKIRLDMILVSMLCVISPFFY